MNNESLIYKGELTTITLLSGREVVIRETNGEDDGILSRLKDASDGTNVHNFLAGIIEEDKSLGGKKPTAADIMDWLVNDKYYLLFKQRLINQGPEFLFRNKCQNCKKENEFVEDLKVIDEEAKEKYKYPFKDKKEIEITTSRGHRIRIHLLDGFAEKEGLSVQSNETNNQNTSLIARHIELYDNNQWIRIFDFKRFPSKEMSEIRGFIKKNDTQFDPIVTFTCSCGREYSAPLLFIPVFFYPEEGTQM